LREAERRIERFQIGHHIPGFVASDFVRVYSALRALAESNLAAGGLFCEWGSGFGVVSCLAAMLDFEVWGIEIEGELVDAARRLAEDFEIPATFVRGSFIPPGGKISFGDGDGFNWLSTEGEDLQHEMDLGPEDFNVIYAYPWPDEESVIERLFEQIAGDGAILVTYHSDERLRFQRKIPRRSRR
jgi:hypothetical protein